MAADSSENPGIYEHPTLDGIPIPGTCVTRQQGGDRDIKVEQQQQPGFAGAFTMVRGEEMALVTYQIECVDKASRDAVRAWLPAMRAAQKARQGGYLRPTAFRFSDPALEHCEIRSVIVKTIGGWVRVKPSNKWTIDVTFAEWKKRVPIGGAAGPRAKSEVEKLIEDVNAQNKALEKQLAAMNRGK